MKLKRVNIYTGLILAMLFWAFSFIWYKQAYLHLQPMALVFFRLVIASLFVGIILSFSNRFEKIDKGDYKYFILLVIIEPLLYFIGESYGMKMVSASLGAIIVSLIPLLTPILAFWLFKEKLSWVNFAGITISFGGVLFVLIGKGFTLNAPLAGVALMFMAVLCAVGYSGVVYFLAKKYRPMTIIWIQSIFGAMLFLPLFLIFDYKETLVVQWSWDVISPVVKLGIFPSALSFLFYNLAIKEIGITKANVFTNFIPVITAILSYHILKEDISVGKIIGILLVLTGLLISQRKKRIQF